MSWSMMLEVTFNRRPVFGIDISQPIGYWQVFDCCQWPAAVNVNSPYFAGYPGFTRRPVLMDRIDWVNGWPEVRDGAWASDTPQLAPAAQPWEYTPLSGAQLPGMTGQPASDETIGPEIAALSDEFNEQTLSPQWTFIHPNADNSYVLTGSTYEVQTHGPDENVDPQHVSILAEPVPSSGDWMVETKVTTSVPFDNSCCFNFAQGALFIYGNDQNSIKADVFPEWDTRQTEFGKQVGPVPAGYPTYDHQNIGPAGETTWLRIACRHTASGELYTSYSSTDGKTWTKGGTWQDSLGSGAMIGISAENTPGFTMDFDYVRVYSLAPEFGRSGPGGL